MSDTMTPKERWLAAVTLGPVDRLLFWPKINALCPRATRTVCQHALQRYLRLDQQRSA